MRIVIIALLLFISFTIPDTDFLEVQLIEVEEANVKHLNETITGNTISMNDSIECDNCQANQMEDDYSFFYIGLFLGTIFIVIRKKRLKYKN